ncbi:MAG: rRNA cytosine-C5-methyltransferase [Bacteroidales bacterium]
MAQILSLPETFKKYLLEVAGTSNTPLILDAIQNSESAVSIRINPLKVSYGDANCVITPSEHLRQSQNSHTPLVHDILISLCSGDYRQIPWCKDGFYLPERPVFTLDPSLHSGAYYVQEPSSMFLAVLEPVFNVLKPRNLLDLCAAPGGKTTHLISMMPHESKLVANEVIRARVAPLKENVIKWGDHSVEVISMDVAKIGNGIGFGDAGELLHSFDFVLVDAPCSGEGMFRKDPSAVNEWSEENVKLCAARQRRILTDIWGQVKPGGLLAYSTCTFNRYENDENITWLKSTYGAEIFDLFEFYRFHGLENKFNTDLVKGWGIVQTKEGGFQFFPGLVEGEGFFFALLQKPDSQANFEPAKTKISKGFHAKKGRFERTGSSSGKSGFALQKENAQPEPEYALSIDYSGEWPSVELNRDNALQYLSRNSIKLQDSPLGYVRVTYKGLGLGFVKNLGNRANNLYPMNWRIRMQLP